MSANGIDGWYQASHGRATFGFRVADGEVVETAPYGRKIIMGLRWATAYMVLEQGGFEVARISEPAPIDASVWDPSLVRQAFDELLKRYPMFDVVSVDWGVHEGNMLASPWVIVLLGQASERFDERAAWALWPFAIWRSTGALHTMDGKPREIGQFSYGAVSDDPIWQP